MSRQLRVRYRAYAFFKEWWRINHVTLEERLKTTRAFCDYEDTCEEGETEPDAYEVWLFASGRYGSIYPAYYKFLDSEYKNVSFITELIRMSGDSNNKAETECLIADYLADVTEMIATQ